MKSFLAKYKKILFVLIILVAGGWLLWSRNTSAKAKSSVETKQVRRGVFVKTISSSGKTAANRSVELKFQTSGKLIWVGVKQGDHVNAYQAIAKLDSKEVEKTLEKSLRDYSSKRNDFEEAWRVTYSGKKPEQALTDTVKRILEKNQWDLEKAVLDVELKHLAVEYSTLITPIEGIVTHVDTPTAGVNITPATAVFEVADPESVVFEANVDETDIGLLIVGQSAKLTLDAFPQQIFSGAVSYIFFTSEVSSGGATVFPVKVIFEKPQNIRLGLNGDIEIEAGRQENVLLVPTEAVREDQNGNYVYKKDKGIFRIVKVEIGSRNEDEIIVKGQGLAEGDLVVTKGFSNIPK